MRIQALSKKSILWMFAVTSLVAVFLYAQNNDISTHKFTITNPKVPDVFNGFVIVQISDLHNMRFGKGQEILLQKVSAAQPDLIVVTGDIIDSIHTDIPLAMEFIQGAINIAPVAYVPGNHEARIDNYEQLINLLADVGVRVLENNQFNIERNHEHIELLGIVDPFFKPASVSLNALNLQDPTSFKILLSHRPELIKLYASKNIDLVFTGHAHGGQIRIPYLRGGLIAPDQGLFPKYTSGIYFEMDTTEVVSRGLGNSIFPLRIFNRPEIIVVTLSNH